MVCPDLDGPVRNGGVGTANYQLARVLSQAGHSVEILFTQPAEQLEHNHGRWRRRYQDMGVKVTVLDAWSGFTSMKPVYPDHEDVRRAYAAYQWTRLVAPDLCVVNDWRGHGFFICQARRAQADLVASPVILIAHGTTLWDAIGNRRLPDTSSDTLTMYLERSCVEMADAVIAPSAYMLRWLADHGVELPERSFVQPNPYANPNPHRGHQSGLPSGVAFFGRLEERKGLVDFCDAVDLLIARGLGPPKVAFIGKPGVVAGRSATDYLIERTRPWPCDVDFYCELDSVRAIETLIENGYLAVVASLTENSPYTVIEALVAGVPLVACDTGGIAELIEAEDRDQILYGRGPTALAEKLAHRLNTVQAAQRLAFCQTENDRFWAEGLPALATVLNSGPIDADDRAPTITVCMVHHNRPILLEQAIDSLLNQTDDDFSVVLVDDGSIDSARVAIEAHRSTFADRGWKVILRDNGYLGAARNTAWRAATTEYVLFMDDDNVAHPEMIERFRASARRSGADLITCAFDVFAVDYGQNTRECERFLPLGPAVGEAVHRNLIGDANALVRRSALDEIGGFTEDRNVGHEDLELFVSLVLTGARVVSTPEVLFRYRRHSGSMLSVTSELANQARSLRPFFKHVRPPVQDLVLGASLASVQKMTTTTGTLAESTMRDPVDRLICELLASGRQQEAAQTLARHDEGHGGGCSARLCLSVTQFLETGRLTQAQRLFAATTVTPHEKIDVTCCALRAALASPEGTTASPAFENTVLTLTQESWSDEDRLMLLGRLIRVACARSDADAATGYLGEAVSIASVFYARRRPDVSESVSRGEVQSCLDHYCRYGQAEGVTWPAIDYLT